MNRRVFLSVIWPLYSCLCYPLSTRADGDVKAFIRQEETAVQIKAKAEGSEYEFDHDAHQYGVDTWRNVGYGYWQQACQVTLTKTE